MRLTLNALRYFHCAVECGSISKAAEKMNVVPSAIFAAVNQVELAFGLQLVSRQRSKGIHLTATGNILLDRISHLLDEYESLLKGGADLKNRLTGTLRIGYYAPVAPAFMPNIIHKLVDNNDAVTIKMAHCDNHSAQEGLLAGDYDVILCVAEGMRPGVAYETLLDMSAYLLVKEDHVLANRKNITLKNIEHERMVLLDLPVVGEYYTRIFEKAKVTPPIVATATTIEMVRSLVGSGIGSSVLHMRPFVDVSYSGHRLAAIPFSPKVMPLRLVIGYLSENPRRLVQAFVDESRRYFLTEQAMAMVVA